jgi:hypothetical protein
MPNLGLDRARPLIAVLPEPSADPPRSRAEWIGRLSVQIKGLTVAQFPNAPLAVWLVAKLVAMSTSGSTQDAAELISVIGLAIWALFELVSGVNWFRRGFGLVTLVGIVFYN